MEWIYFTKRKNLCPCNTHKQNNRQASRKIQTNKNPTKLVKLKAIREKTGCISWSSADFQLFHPSMYFLFMPPPFHALLFIPPSFHTLPVHFFILPCTSYSFPHRVMHFLFISPIVPCTSCVFPHPSTHFQQTHLQPRTYLTMTPLGQGKGI